MREQAAHQDFYGNLLLEPAAARGLVAAGAAAAGAPGPLTTPRRPEPASAHPGSSRVAGSRRVRGVEGTWGGGGREGAVGSPGAAGTRAPAPGPAPSSCGDALVPRRERNGPRSRFRGLGGGRIGIGLAVPPRSPASGSWPRFPCPALQPQLGLRPVSAVSGAFSVLQDVFSRIAISQ
ncbi:cuticle collagen 6-like [Kogia breviceps]|uniref:cuticle collagen 6-like n=1 Tax=Kogia breviceps TaxID=27615 RepID=UPI0034D1A838